jgi:hypothetical protein
MLTTRADDKAIIVSPNYNEGYANAILLTLTNSELDLSLPACLPACRYQLSLNTIATAGLEKSWGRLFGQNFFQQQRKLVIQFIALNCWLLVVKAIMSTKYYNTDFRAFPKG